VIPNDSAAIEAHSVAAFALPPTLTCVPLNRPGMWNAARNLTPRLMDRLPDKTGTVPVHLADVGTLHQ
jgi:hypothetical protein